MDKRGARIIFGCLAGTFAVILLFFLASLLTQKSCELIIIEPTQIRSAALADWPKEKPIRSHDKSTLFKISAYLEYNIQPSTKDKPQNAPVSDANHTSQSNGVLLHETPNQQQQQPAQQHSPLVNGAPNLVNGQQQQVQPNQPAQVSAQASSQLPSAAAAPGKGPTPSVPQSGFTNQQLASSGSSLNFTGDSKSEKPRFLPLKVEGVEIKKLDDNKFSYKINFNCSWMKLVLVKNKDRVFIEKATMELKPKSQKKDSCELQLPAPEMFTAEVGPLDGWAHYYCDKPLKYSCYHNSSKRPGQPGILLAELHINSIEFETSGLGGQASNSIHKSHDFEGARGKYCAAS